MAHRLYTGGPNEKTKN